MRINKHLSEAIKNDKLVIFAGAGVSKKLELPDWTGFVKEIMDKYCKNKPELYSCCRDMLNNNEDPVAILDKLKNDFQVEIREHIKKNFKVNADKTLDTHINILNLSSKVITTNYDDAFEKAYKSLYNKKCKCTVIGNTDISKLSDVKNNPHYILKLHGCCSSPESCVVFTSDYNKIYNEPKALIESLKAIFINSTILFIGFSFKDIRIKFILSNLGDDLFKGKIKHFILTDKGTDFESYKFLNTIYSSKYNINDFLIKCQEHSTISYNKKVEEILKLRLFSGIDNKRQLAQELGISSNIKELNKDDYLCKEGEEVVSFWLIIKGTILVKNNDILKSTRTKNSVVGELSFLEGGTRHRSSNLIAGEDGTEVLEITKGNISKLSSKYKTSIWKNLGSMLCNKVNKQDDLVNSMHEYVNSVQEYVDSMQKSIDLLKGTIDKYKK